MVIAIPFRNSLSKYILYSFFNPNQGHVRIRQFNSEKSEKLFWATFIKVTEALGKISVIFSP